MSSNLASGTKLMIKQKHSSSKMTIIRRTIALFRHTFNDILANTQQAAQPTEVDNTSRVPI